MLIFTLVCLGAIAVSVAVLRATRPTTGPVRAMRAMAWSLLAGGLGALALLALAQFMGRFGPDRFWFREPTFFVAIVVLAGATVWWLRRPAPALQRFGLPALLVALAGIAMFLARVDGRSTPLAMSMPTLGIEAPSLTWLDSKGERHSLAELKGRVVLLNFWATWCTPCRREMPLLSRLQRAHAANGLVVLYVSLEEQEVLDPFLAANRFDGVHGRLDQAAAYYGAGKFYPLSYLISRDGRVEYRWSGRPAEDWLTGRVRELL
jgi:cytochrome c biogenesis protein CcmG, thiol:disulfide interchange protein DsbE